MTKYLVVADKTTTFYLEVEADNATIAQRIASDTHVSDWNVDGSDDMKIVGVHNA